MNYWIGVISSKLTLDKFATSSDLWFCLPRTAQVGDQVLIYASSKASYSRNGVIGSYRISALDVTKNNLCTCYGALSGDGARLIYVSLELGNHFLNPITLKLIKKDPMLCSSSFVRKNMQATYFEISKDEHKKIESMWDKLGS